MLAEVAEGWAQIRTYSYTNTDMAHLKFMTCLIQWEFFVTIVDQVIYLVNACINRSSWILSSCNDPWVPCPGYTPQHNACFWTTCLQVVIPYTLTPFDDIRIFQLDKIRQNPTLTCMYLVRWNGMTIEISDGFHRVHLPIQLHLVRFHNFLNGFTNVT